MQSKWNKWYFGQWAVSKSTIKMFIWRKRNSSHVQFQHGIFNSMPIFNSSKKSSWPILLYINELPPSQRFKHVLLCALWVEKKEPTSQIMTLYLKQFVQDVKELYKKGIMIDDGDRQIVFKFAAMCCSADSVTRPIIQNRLQYNGYYGCS